MDPMTVIKNYTGSKLHESKQPANCIGYGLEVVYCYITGESSLDSAQKSKFDAIAPC